MANGYTMSLEWYGDQLLRQFQDQMIQAVDSVLADCAAEAQTLVAVDTGALKNDIQFKGAKRSGGSIAGSFGAYSVKYAIYQELGTYKMPAHPYLRPVADRLFPTLLQRVGPR